MDDHRFDAFTKRLAAPRTRRETLRLLGGSLSAGLVGLSGRSALAAKGNSACAHFCATVFGADTPAASQCTSQAAHGHGLCYDCGPASDGSQKVCGTTCIPRTSCCTNSDCVAPETCLANGTCAKPCTRFTECPPGCGCYPTTYPAQYCGLPLAGPGCSSDAGCPVGQACFGGDCVAVC